MSSIELCFSEISEHKGLTDFYVKSALEISPGWEKESGVFFSEAVFEKKAVLKRLAPKKNSVLSATLGGIGRAFRFELGLSIGGGFNRIFEKSLVDKGGDTDNKRNDTENKGEICENKGVDNESKAIDTDLADIKGAYSLSRRHGVVMLDYIAVKSDLRKIGIGSILLKRIKERCKKDGIKRIYLTAKAKDFFLKNGATELSGEHELFDSLLGECAECLQRGKDCFPAVMMIEI